MVFVLTLFYISISLMSPAVLPDFLQGIHILEILGVLLILCSLPSIGSSKILSHPATYLVTGVLLAATLSILATGWIGGALDAFIGFVPIIFTFYFIVIGCTTLNRLVILTYVLCAVALSITAQGMIAEFTGDFMSPYLLDEPTAGVSLYRHRGLGVIADPNDLGQVLVAVVPLLWIRSRKGKPMQTVFLTLLPALGLIVGIYYTHSRGSLIALIAVVLFGFKDAIGVIGSSILSGLFAMGVVAINASGGRGLSQDDGERISLWSQALTAFKTHPLFGVGIGHFNEYNNLNLTAHNSYVLCLAEMGIIGYFFWMGSIVSIWTGLSEIVRAEKPPKAKKDEGLTPWSGERERTPQDRLVNLPVADGPVYAYAMSSGTAARFESLSAMGNGLGFPEEVQPKEALHRSAKAIRTALVGALAAAFFISRTYSIILYVLLGMAAALQIISWKQNEASRAITGVPLFKKIGYIMAGSVLFLYLFVRLHGAG